MVRTTPETASTSGSPRRTETLRELRGTPLSANANVMEFDVVEELANELETLGAEAQRMEEALVGIPALHAEVDRCRRVAGNDRRRVEELEHELRDEIQRRTTAVRQLKDAQSSFAAFEATKNKETHAADEKLTSLLASARSAHGVHAGLQEAATRAQREALQLRAELRTEQTECRIALDAAEGAALEAAEVGRASDAERRTTQRQLADFLPQADMLTIEIEAIRENHARAQQAAQLTLARHEAAAELDAQNAQSELSHAESTFEALIVEAASEQRKLSLQLARTAAASDAQRAALTAELSAAARTFEAMLATALSERDVLSVQLLDEASSVEALREAATAQIARLGAEAEQKLAAAKAELAATAASAREAAALAAGQREAKVWEEAKRAAVTAAVADERLRDLETEGAIVTAQLEAQLQTHRRDAQDGAVQLEAARAAELAQSAAAARAAEEAEAQHAALAAELHATAASLEALRVSAADEQRAAALRVSEAVAVKEDVTRAAAVQIADLVEEIQRLGRELELA